MTRLHLPALYSILAILLFSLPSCQEDSNIGSTITKGEVRIEVDSLFEISGHPVRYAEFDSRSKTLLLGRIENDAYGALDCSYAGGLMPAAALSIPDSIGIEDIAGMSLKLSFNRSEITGDSLSPQQLTVYRLNKSLPSTVNNLTDLAGYYDSSSPLGQKSFTAVSLGLATQTKTGVITIPLSRQYAKEVVQAYRDDPSLFSRPENFARLFAGIIVKSTFGRGLVINMSTTEFTTYYNYTRRMTVVKDGVSTVIDSLFTDSTTLFSISPEVLSANLLRLTPSQDIMSRVAAGEYIIQSPGGYNVQMRFPADKIIERYYSEDFNLSVVNSLSLEVPVHQVPNDCGLTYPPYLLMIKTSRLSSFFINNELPEEDDSEVFYAAYNPSRNSYVFSSLRPYIIKYLQQGATPGEDDMDFTLVPVNITLESLSQGTTTKSLVTECRYYLARPTLCRLDFSAAKVRFTYSRQVMQ